MAEFRRNPQWVSLLIATSLAGCATAENLDSGPDFDSGLPSGGASSGGASAGGSLSSAGGTGSGSTSAGGGSASGGTGSASDSGPPTGGAPNGADSGAGGTSRGGAGGATSAGGGGGSSIAATFGGVYAGAGPKCTSTACYTGNVRASGACSCPSGFTPSTAISFLDDRACPNDNPPYGWSSMYVCYAGAFTAMSDFGGAYHREGTTTCHVGNPLAAAACACPTGSQAIELIVDHSCWNDTMIGFCWNPTAPLTTFGGAYEISDHTGYGNNGCVTGNPAAAGACACPAGTTATEIRDVYGPGNGNCKNTGAFGGHLYVCGVN